MKTPNERDIDIEIAKARKTIENNGALSFYERARLEKLQCSVSDRLQVAMKKMDDIMSSIERMENQATELYRIVNDMD